MLFIKEEIIRMGKADRIEEEKPTSFLGDLVSKACRPTFVTATYEYVSDVAQYTSPRDLLEIIGVEKNLLSKTAAETVDILETQEKRNRESSLSYDDFKWKLTAFAHIQDIFDCPLYPDGGILNVYHLWYFYYESKYILIESLLCGLNGFCLASNVLLRLFLEFSVLQNYYYRITRDQQSYGPLEKYFRSRVHPGWNSIVNGALPKDSFTKPIKFRLDMHHKALSESCTHAYHPDLSPKQRGTFMPEPSLESIYFWYTTKLAVEAVLWAYYANFPMLFHPVNRLRKFGFTGPVGLFIDALGGHVIKKSLSNAEYSDFLEYAGKQDQVVSLLDYYNSLRKLSDDEILKTWPSKENGPIENIHEGFCKQMAMLRATSEFMALKPVTEEMESNQVKKVLGVFSYEKWKHIYKHVTKRKTH